MEWVKVVTRRPKILDEQRGYILGLVLISFVIFTIMGLAFINMSSFERLHVLDYYEKVKAFYHAEAGIQKGLWLVNRVSAAAATFSDSTVSVVYDSVNLVMTATGQAGNAQKIIQVTLQSSSSGWPYAGFAGNKVKLNAKDISGILTGNIHGNDDVSIGSGISVHGTITEAPPTVNAPTVDWDFFKDEAIAAGQYVTSDKTFNSSGSPYSGVWYTTKKAKVEANTVINGTIVAEKDCQFEGNNITITATPSNYPALVGKKKIIIKKEKSIQLNGFIYAKQDFKIEKEASVTIHGSLTVLNNITSNKEDIVSITYDSTYTSNVAGITFNTSTGSNLKILTWNEP